MNYDTQYAFSHGLASAPQFQTLQQQHLQQRQHQFQQHQQVFPQHQYGQIAPTSNVFFQFTGGGNPIFQQKDIHQMALPTGGIQQTPLGTQHGMVASSFVKQGVPVRMEGNCVHLVGGTEGMIYQPQPQQSDLKIITANPDARMLQQHSHLEAGLGIPQNTATTLLGIDMMGGQPQPILDQGTLDMGHTHHQQHQGIAMAGQGGMLSYSKQQTFSGPWLQPQQQQVSSSAANIQQQQQQTQSALPSFTHLWSQFQQHKNQAGVGIPQQQQAQLNTLQQSQQFQSQNQLQQSQQQFAAATSSFPAVAGMPMINMSHFQDQPQQQSPLPVLSNQIACFSPHGPSSTPSPCPGDRLVPASDCALPNTSLAIHTKATSSQASLSVVGDSPQHTTPSLLTDSSTVPPKVTVILDSLPHCETFPPTTHFQGNSDAALKLGASSVISCADPPSIRNRHRVATTSNQLNLQQKKLALSRPLKPISSTGSSMERSSSESSNFSSPPYTFTPPNSNDSMFSPVAQVFHQDEPALAGSILETQSSICLSSSSLSSAMSPSSMSSSPLQNTPSALPKTTGKNLAMKSDGGKCNPPPLTQTANSSTMATVATVLALSSPSTTTVITAMASSHQLVTTTTTTTSVTHTSHCLIDGTATTVRSCSSASDQPTHLSKPTKTSVAPYIGELKSCPETMNSTQSCMEKKVKVPFSWHRKLDNGSIVYLSPSGTALQSYEQICQYLLSDSTCKCGLECPIQVEEFFNFDPAVGSQAWTSETEDSHTDKDRIEKGGKQKQEDLRKLCNHRREVLALAAFHNSQSQMSTENSMRAGKKRDRKKSVSGGENLILSPLKRLKTSITNAVNRHAVSTGKRKNPMEGSETSSGSPPDVIKQQELDSVVPSSVDSVLLEDHRVERSSTISVVNRKKMFLGESEGHKDQQEIHSSTVDTSHQKETEEAELEEEEQNSVARIELDFPYNASCQPLKSLDSDQIQQRISSDIAANCRQPDATSSQNHGFDVGCSNLSRPQIELVNLVSSPDCQNSESAQPEGHFPKHSTPINKKPDLKGWTDPMKQGGQTLSNHGSPKSKSKRTKSKKEKQKVISASPNSYRGFKSAKSKTTGEDDLSLPSSTVSFLENPTVFVAQQTVMINNSMASCNIAYSSPGPAVPSSSPTDMLTKSEKKQERISSSGQQSATSFKLEDEERKLGTDTDSNRSFSDTTENNDSAYLSQTGSDQERSDTIDGSDSCLDTHKALDVYDFSCSEEREFKPDPGIVHVNMKASDIEGCKGQNPMKVVKTSLSESKLPNSNVTSAIVKELVIQEKPPVPKPRPKQKSSPLYTKRGSQPKNGLEDPLKRDDIGSLNRDLSNLLASDNWNIPAVQQVLAQYSGGDPGQLNAAIQQVLSQASTAGVDFPASNLLTAAAKAQVKGSGKKPPNGVLSSRVVTPPVCIKSENLPVTHVSGPRNKIDSKPPGNKQLQRQDSLVSQPTGVLKNVVHASQGSSAGVTTNAAAPLTNHEVQQSSSGSTFSPDASLLKAIEPDTNVTATANPLVNAQAMPAPPVCQPIEIGQKLGLPMPPVLPTSLAQGSSGSNPVILNGFGTPRMIVNSQIPPVSVVTTSVSKTAPMTIGLNQAMFGAVSTPGPHLAQPHLLATGQQQQHAGSTCIINASNHQIGKPTGNAGQPSSLQATNTQQLITPSGPQPTQLAAAQQANTQIVNALSVQGLNPNQQLLLPQMSPCNPVSQLSPAMAAQLLTQNQQQQQLQQMSPSFLTGSHPQLQKLPQSSVLGNQTSIFASVPLPPFSAAPATSNCSGLFTQASTCIPPPQTQQQQQQQRSGDGATALPAILSASVDGTDQLAHSLSQVKDVAAAPMFAATSQPVFVIPQAANPNPVVQVLGSTQSLTTATDLNVQQQNNNLAAQLFGQQQSQQAATFDPTQLQNLLSAGFNPLALQQTINTVNLSGVHQQQQQQLQMLQLQQLMLQQFQNQQSQGLQGISIPGPQAAPQAIVNAVMPAQNLPLSSMVDMNAIHSSLSPVAAAAAATHQNLLGNHLPPAQLHITSSIGTQPVIQGSTPASVSVLQNTGLQKVSQTAAVKTISSGTSQIQAPAVTTATGKNSASTIVATQQENFHQKPVPSGTQMAQPGSQPQPLTTSTNKPAQAASASPAPSSTLTPTSPASSSSKSSSSSSKSSKSKSKSKKSETKKVIDPESERNEEDIAATVQQILAQAVQQQRELNLAAKNQPPPPPKSKSKKSQARSKSNSNQMVGAVAAPALNKEHDLGKLPSIMSDDIVIHKSEQAVSSGPVSVTAVSPVTSSLIQPPPSASSCDSSSLGSRSGQNRPAQPVQLPVSSKLQTQQSSFSAPVGSAPPPPPVASRAAARSAQSSQPAESEPLVISSMPAQHIMNPACPPLSGKVMSQALYNNGAVVSDNNAQANLCSASSIATETVIQNKNSVAHPNQNSVPCSSSKKSAISLKDHLSSIISKDKDNSKKKVNGSPSTPCLGRTKDVEELSKTTSMLSLPQQTALKLEPVGQKVLRKSVK